MKPHVIALSRFLAGSAVVLFAGCEPLEVDASRHNEAQTIRAAVADSYQAEAHTFQTGCSIRSNHDGYTGTGFMDYGGEGSIVEWGNVVVPVAGQYTLTFRWANGSRGDRRCLLTVNDTTRIGNVSFEPTGAWTTWQSSSITVPLKAGRNKIRLTANTGAGGPNLDKMDVVSAGNAADQCVEVDEGATATLSCPSGEVIASIGFASYGVPVGSCSDGLSTGTCHASNSVRDVEARCLNEQSCTVGANNGTFGDPCAGIYKKLAIVYSCTTDGDDGGDAKIFGNHVGGYQNGVTSGGFVPRRYDAGYSMYVAAWSLFERAPDKNTQTGLFGTWMHGQRVENPPIDRMYSDIEGGLGWWRDTRFATETPKFIMGGVALNFSSIANGPGAGAGDWNNPRGKYGVAQLSPWLLWPPDGLNIERGASGELLGYGYLPLPLTEPKTVTAGRNVVTGDQSWTLFLNTENFKGPATFFLPYFFSKPSVENPALSGMFLDSRPASAGGQIAMETQHTPAAQATARNGRTYARVAPLLFPSEQDGTSILIHNLFYYDKTALWDDVSSWFRGGAPATGFIRSGNYFRRTFSRHHAGWSIWENPASGGDHKAMDWADYRTSITSDPHTVSVRWNRDLVKRISVRGRDFNLFPEYLALDPSTQEWKPVRPADVPNNTGLKRYTFPRPSRNRAPYVTPTDRNSVWKRPGPVAGPFYAYPGDGSKVTYYWFRFADQPAMLNADMSDAERERVQKRVEKLHRHWTKEREYLAPPAIDKPLVRLDPALIVEPPAGLKIGYVPIVTRQESAN